MLVEDSSLRMRVAVNSIVCWSYLRLARTASTSVCHLHSSLFSGAASAHECIPTDNKDAVPPLSEVQVTKLKQLSLLSLASDSRTLPYGKHSRLMYLLSQLTWFQSQTFSRASWTSPTSANSKTSSSRPSMRASCRADSTSATPASPSTA